MPSSRVIGKLLTALLLLVSAFGHLHHPAIAGHFAHPGAQPLTIYRVPEKKPALAVQWLATKPSKQEGTTEKRHKRVLISKVFRPVVAFTIIKRYRLVEPARDYSSTHILQRSILAFSLRGPPAYNSASFASFV